MRGESGEARCCHLPGAVHHPLRVPPEGGGPRLVELRVRGVQDVVRNFPLEIPEHIVLEFGVVEISVVCCPHAGLVKRTRPAGEGVNLLLGLDGRVAARLGVSGVGLMAARKGLNRVFTFCEERRSAQYSPRRVRFGWAWPPGETGPPRTTAPADMGRARTFCVV